MSVFALQSGACFLPEPLAAGGGDVVVLAASVDGCLDFSLAALWGEDRR